MLSYVKFLKSIDKRPVCMLATSKNHRCVIVQGKHSKLKPDYFFFFFFDNDAKEGVDLSDSDHLCHPIILVCAEP